MTVQRHTAWRDLPVRWRKGIVAAGIVQGILALTAWRELFRRPATRVNGPKPLWALAIAVNFVGPIAYFRWGRRHDLDTDAGQSDAGSRRGAVTTTPTVPDLVPGVPPNRGALS